MSQKPPSRQQPAPSAPPFPAIIAAAVVLLVIGLVVGLIISRMGSSQQASTSDTVAQVFPTPATRTYSAPPPLTIDPAKTYTATITTPRGPIEIELLPDIAPQTVNNFVFLARQNFYNGLTWHRVLPGFMAQGGDPNGDGTGDPGYSIPAEFTDQILYDRPGLVAMARSADPDSAGSQFFITTAPAEFLNNQYTIFGRVIAGQEIVDGIPLRDPDNPADLATPGETILGITIAEQ